MRKNKEEKTVNDIEKCKEKIQKILNKYNCRLIAADEYTEVLLQNKETEETSTMRIKGF